MTKPFLSVLQRSCFYFGALGRSGTYVLEITSPTYETFTSGEITVTEDECHVITQQKEFALQPIMNRKRSNKKPL